MGWLRKTFKKIGKGIKKAFMKFGKFMGKIGILGQVAMMFILPGIGQAIGGAIKGFIGQTAAQAGATAAGTAASTAASASAAQAGASAAAQAAAGQAAFKTAAAAATKAGIQGTATGLFAGGTASQAAGHFLQFAGKAAAAPFKAFQSVTNAVTSTIGEFTKTAASKLGMNVQTASSNFFTGTDSAISRVGQSVRSPFSATARAEIATRKATQLFAKEGLTQTAFDNTLLKGAEAASVEMDNLITGMTDRVVSPRVPMGPAGTPLGDSLKLPEGEFVQTSMSPTDSIMAKPQGMSIEDFAQDFSATPQEGLVSYTSQSGQVMYGPENVLETMQAQGIDTATVTRTPLGTMQQLGADLKKVGTDFIDYTSTGISEKAAKLKDPAAVLQAGASVAQKAAADQEFYDMQSQMLASSGEVVNLGIIQNPEAMLGSAAPQVMQSPIQGLQAPANYNAPLSAWGQQYMFDPFNLQMNSQMQRV